jgi:hypothetical protein
MTDKEKQIRESIERCSGYTLNDMRYLLEVIDEVRNNRLTIVEYSNKDIPKLLSELNLRKVQIDTLKGENEELREKLNTTEKMWDEMRRIAAFNTNKCDELRANLDVIEKDIKRLHYHSASRLPDLSVGSLGRAHVETEVRNYEFILELLSKIRGEK